MTFSSIIRKNFYYNFNKFISFYFVNSLIIAMLFMYGSLIYNPSILDSVGKTTLYETVNMALLGIVLFSVVFITYTNISFLKNRGKEFGMYLTLGMTTKDLTKIIFVENLGIMSASLVTGVFTGALFGRLFYLGLNRFLINTKVVYELNYKSFLLSIGVFVLIFIGNLIFNIIYIKRISIIDSIKASKKKEIGNTHVILGAIALVILVISMYCLPKTLLKEIFKDQSYMIGVFVALIMICPYIVIGSLMGVVKSLLRRFPKTYNSNLLVLSNLSHRFLSYKNILYMLSILTAGAMFFVGYSYSMFKSSEEFVRRDNPYDLMFIETEKYNVTEKEDIEEVISDSGGKIEKYSVLEYVEIPLFREDRDQYIYRTGSQMILSETNYNEHMGTNIDISSKGALYVTTYEEKMEFQHPTSILTSIDESRMDEFQEVALKNNFIISEDQINEFKDDNIALVINGENIKEEKGVPFVNERSTMEYSLGNALVLDDEDYEFLKSSRKEEYIKKVHLLNVKNGDVAFEGLVYYLRDKNGFDESYWQEGNLWGTASYDERGTRELYRPIYTEEPIEMQLNDNGMMFFTMIFIGALFVIANGVVLYYKVLADIAEEEERLTALARIGIHEKEIKTMISNEIGITFFMPVLFGGGLGLYFLYVMVSNSGVEQIIMKQSMLVLICGIVFQIIFYLICRRKYIKEVVR